MNCPERRHQLALGGAKGSAWPDPLSKTGRLRTFLPGGAGSAVRQRSRQKGPADLFERRAPCASRFPPPAQRGRLGDQGQVVQPCARSLDGTSQPNSRLPRVFGEVLDEHPSLDPPRPSFDRRFAALGAFTQLGLLPKRDPGYRSDHSAHSRVDRAYSLLSKPSRCRVDRRSSNLECLCATLELFPSWFVSACPLISPAPVGRSSPRPSPRPRGLLFGFVSAIIRNIT